MRQLIIVPTVRKQRVDSMWGQASEPQWSSYSMSFYLRKVQNSITPDVWEILKGGMGRAILIYINIISRNKIMNQKKKLPHAENLSVQTHQLILYISHSNHNVDRICLISTLCLWLSMCIWSCRTYFLWITIYLASLLLISFLLLNIHLPSFG